MRSFCFVSLFATSVLVSLCVGLNPNCPFINPKPLDSDTEHPCIKATCSDDWFTPACTHTSVRFCLETSKGQNDTACRSYSKLCPQLFTGPEKHSRNATVRMMLEPLWPCADPNCKSDLFGAGCMRTMFHYCESLTRAPTAKHNAFCDTLKELCPFSPRSGYGEWVCISSECASDIRSKACMDQFADVCGQLDADDGPVPLVCDAFKTESQGDKVLEWILSLARPDATVDYNKNVVLGQAHGPRHTPTRHTNHTRMGL